MKTKKTTCVVFSHTHACARWPYKKKSRNARFATEKLTVMIHRPQSQHNRPTCRSRGQGGVCACNSVPTAYKKKAAGVQTTNGENIKPHTHALTHDDGRMNKKSEQQSIYTIKNEIDSKPWHDRASPCAVIITPMVARMDLWLALSLTNTMAP